MQFLLSQEPNIDFLHVLLQKLAADCTENKMLKIDFRVKQRKFLYFAVIKKQ